VSDEQNQRRRFPRIASENVVLVRGAGASAEGLAKTRALGLGGCSFVSDTAQRVDSVVEVLLSLGGRVVSARSRVVYSNPAGARHEVGVEFLEIDPEDRDYLQSYFAQRGGGA